MAFVVEGVRLAGELLADIPVDGQHLVFALEDIVLTLGFGIASGVLMLRRQPRT